MSRFEEITKDINTLRKNGSAEEIIRQHNRAKKRALREYEESQSLLRMYENMKKDCVTAAEAGFSLEDILKRKK